MWKATRQRETDGGTEGALKRYGAGGVECVGWLDGLTQPRQAPVRSYEGAEYRSMNERTTGQQVPEINNSRGGGGGSNRSPTSAAVAACRGTLDRTCKSTST